MGYNAGMKIAPEQEQPADILASKGRQSEIPAQFQIILGG